MIDVKSVSGIMRRKECDQKQMHTKGEIRWFRNLDQLNVFEFDRRLHFDERCNEFLDEKFRGFTLISSFVTQHKYSTHTFESRNSCSQNDTRGKHRSKTFSIVQNVSKNRTTSISTSRKEEELSLRGRLISLISRSKMWLCVMEWLPTTVKIKRMQFWQMIWWRNTI